MGRSPKLKGRPFITKKSHANEKEVDENEIRESTLSTLFWRSGDNERFSPTTMVALQTPPAIQRSLFFSPTCSSSSQHHQVLFQFVQFGINALAFCGICVIELVAVFIIVRI